MTIYLGTEYSIEEHQMCGPRRGVPIIQVYSRDKEEIDSWIEKQEEANEHLREIRFGCSVVSTPTIQRRIDACFN